MPIQLNQDARLNELWQKLHTDSTGFRTRVEALLENLLHSTTNLFGTASLLDTGTAEGNVPVLQGATNQLAPSVIPVRPTSAFTGAFPLGRIPNLDADRHIIKHTDLGFTDATWRGWSVSAGLNTTIGRLRESNLPTSIPAAAIVSGTVDEARLPAKNRQITIISGTCVAVHFRYNALNETAPSATYRPPGASSDRTVQLAAGRAGTNIAAATNFPGTGNVSGTTLNINAVLPTLARSQ